MKLYRYLLSIVLLSGLFVSCSKEYDRPPLTEPEYTEAQPNITIAKLKSLYANITDPQLIDVDYIIRGIVVGNDISGNIYKQIYIQDETGGINIGIDQNSMYTEYRVGQELIIHVKGLAMVNYGGQLQIGYEKTNANRIPWEVFKLQAHKNKFPKASNAEPKTITLDQVDESMVNTLIKLENVYFVDGGNQPFSKPDATTNRVLKDGAGRSIIVRNSNYANFAANTLPSGAGTVIGILSKYRNDWQLFLRTADDCQNFGQPLPGNTTNPTTPEVTTQTYFTETFGTTVEKNAKGFWPFIEEYQGYDNKGVTFTDPEKSASIRTTKTFTTPHVWFAAGKDGYLAMDNIDTSAAAGKKLSLKYELVANLYDAGSKVDLNAISVLVDGVEIPVTSKVVSKDGGDDNKVFVMTIPGIPAKKGLSIKFFSKAAANTVGLRLDNVSIVDSSSDVIVITPKQ